MRTLLRSTTVLSVSLAGMLIFPISTFSVVNAADIREQPRAIDDCSVSTFHGPSEVKVLETDFDVRLREQAIIEGQCASFARSHVMGHVYFSGGAAASIAGDGSLLTRSSDRSVAKASEIVCDGSNHSLTFATLVAPLRLIERKDAKYVGVFREEEKWVVAAFETDTAGQIVTMKKFLESDLEIVGVGYFPHPHLNAGVLGVTVKGDRDGPKQLLTYDWVHQSFG